MTNRITSLYTINQHNTGNQLLSFSIKKKKERGYELSTPSAFPCLGLR